MGSDIFSMVQKKKKKLKNELSNANILVCPNLFLETFLQIAALCLFETLFLTVD